MLATTTAIIETALKIVKDEEIDELRIELDSLENKFDKGRSSYTVSKKGGGGVPGC